MGTLKIGWSEKSITPEKKASLAGQFAERISEYVEKPVTVTCMVVESDGEQMILCSEDLLAAGWNVVKEVRKRIAEANKEIDPMKIILASIHTHTAPTVPRTSRLTDGKTAGAATYRQWLINELPAGRKYVEKVNISENPEIATGAEMFELVASQTTAAILEAWENRKTGSFSNAFGRAAVGMCRRAVYSDGSAQMWGDTNTAVFSELEGGNDSGIELMYMFDENKKLTGIVANVACPAQCVQHRLFISPDYWGEVKVRLRKYFGEDIYLLALCSAAGDQCPVDLVRWVEPDSDLNDPNCNRNNPPKRKADPSMFDLQGMRLAGRRVANEIIQVYEDGLDEVQTDVEFAHTVMDCQLPLRRGTLAEAEAARNAIREYIRSTEGDVDYNTVANLQIHLGLLERMEVQEQHDVLPTEVHIMRLGTVAFATNPFELFLDYGNQIRARSAAEQTFLVQIANGHEGYLPTEKAEKGGHYSAFISSGKVGHIGGEQLVRETLTEIRNLFED